MQYLKSVCLHRARILPVPNGMKAAFAATRVGYESASQFNREFGRLFALPPLQKARRPCAAHALPVSPGPATLVSSH